MQDRSFAKKSRRDILDTVSRYIKSTAAGADETSPALAPVTDDLLPQALFASAALSALMTFEQPRSAFYFRVVLDPTAADPFFMPMPGQSFDYSIEISTTRVELRIHAVPAHVPTAPGEYLHILLTFLATTAYVESMNRFFPDKRFTMASPAESMMLDAIGVPEQKRHAARRLLWN